MSELSQVIPHARAEDVVVEEVDGGLIVFDRLSDTAHWLDPAAAAVWGMADGHSDVGVIAASCGRTEAEVAEVLLRLEGLNLMEEQSGGGLSRRAALKKMAKVGGTAVAGAAVISTVVVPNALATSSVCDKVTCSTGGTTYQHCTDAQAAATGDCTSNPACRSQSVCNGTCGGSGSHRTYSGTCVY